MKREKLNVWFRDHVNLIDAVFFYNNEIVTYAHIGQHSTGSIGWLYDSTKPAKPSQYRELLNEVQSVYHEYDLVVKTKLPPFFKTLKYLERQS